MKVVAGLGNPGVCYELTRHNIGFLVLDELADRMQTSFHSGGYSGFYAQTQVKGVDGLEKVILLKPQTYMNLSGRSIRSVVTAHSLSLSDLLVVYDDLDLEFGRVRIKRGGGDGGHRGIRSIIKELGSGDFPRLKVGINRPAAVQTAAQYVLEPFNDEEIKALGDIIDLAARAVLEVLTSGLEEAMNRFNGLQGLGQ